MSSNIRSFLAIEIDENLKKSILNLQNEFKKIMVVLSQSLI